MSDREMGEHDARLKALEQQVAELRADVKSILSVLNEARGGWKTLMLVGGIAGMMGATVAKIAGALLFVPK